LQRGRDAGYGRNQMQSPSRFWVVVLRVVMRD